jgi:hypothetical protein
MGKTKQTYLDVDFRETSKKKPPESSILVPRYNSYRDRSLLVMVGVTSILPKLSDLFLFTYPKRDNI